MVKHSWNCGHYSTTLPLWAGLSGGVIDEKRINLLQQNASKETSDTGETMSPNHSVHNGTLVEKEHDDLYYQALRSKHFVQH